MNKEVLSLLVDNHSGVLTRVASLFGRRGFNIDSLTVSATDNPAISRITIVVQGDEQIIEQIVKQTDKLEETREIFALDPNRSLFRELLLVKVAADETNRSAIREVATIYKAKIIDLCMESMVMELTGEPDKIDSFLDMMKGYQILEMCRTGITALERGEAHHSFN
ncbi:MAG: acetolactate synthase small subunit [Oscillospiraceae bacterium]|nr:acetolactate synthase small subunit [Oscillospiraceae bacterium]